MEKAMNVMVREGKGLMKREGKRGRGKEKATHAGSDSVRWDCRRAHFPHTATQTAKDWFYLSMGRQHRQSIVYDRRDGECRVFGTAAQLFFNGCRLAEKA